MDWKRLFFTALAGPLLMIVVLTLWRYTDNAEAEFQTITEKVDRLDIKFDSKFDALNKLLTDNLLEIKGEIGELKGQAHNHVPS